MKKLAAILTLAATTAFAEDAADEIITVWPENPGLFLFVNAQNRVAREIIAKPVNVIADDFNIDAQLVDKNDAFEIAKVPAELKGLGAKGAIWIVDDSALPLTLAATEEGWGMLNIAPILADSPDVDKTEKRIVKLVERLFGTLHGAADPMMMPACVMKLAVGLAGVDALVCSSYSPETSSKISAYLFQAGYKTRRVGCYYDACVEGWAPVPKNDAQQAIWDEVHRLPTKPMKILPPSKKNK